MKRLILIIPLLTIISIGFANVSNNYVVLENYKNSSGSSIHSSNMTSELTTHDQIFCKKIKIGVQYARIVLDNGDKITVKNSDIESYRLNDQVFYNLPLYENGINTNRMIFMQLVGVKGTYSLFKYSKNIEGVDKRTGVYVGSFPAFVYLVFRGNQYAYDVTESN
jgi:hypothetical protein